jgi:dihydrofolate synthase/folylpolyglutamate synthase
MTQRSLAQWLDYQQSVHALGVDLGLARVREVWGRMGAPRIAPIVIAVGGTNGKGSTVAFLEAMFAAGGKRVGCYTSPHLLRYNERVRIAGAEVDDAALVDAFARIEMARLSVPDQPITLTYFEFGTLAALWIFSQSTLDAAILEVGLGGRLDAVNIVDADAAIVTTIDLDHQDWLGNDRDQIAREKAGIFRADRPAIIGDATAPDALEQSARETAAAVFKAGRDYRFEAAAHGWRWLAGDRAIALPDPALAAPVQRANAAAAIAALHMLRDRVDVGDAAISAGVREARVAGRLQRFVRADTPALVIDVAHNPQAAAVLAQWLVATSSCGRTLAVFGALADKDVDGIVAPLAPMIDRWFIAGLDTETPRGLAAPDLVSRSASLAALVHRESFADVEHALVAALAASRPDDRILAFGSFHVAAPALAWASSCGFVAA